MLRLLKIRFKAFKPFKPLFSREELKFPVDRVGSKKFCSDRAAPTLIEITNGRQDRMTGVDYVFNPT
jgi:hypothetical protein